MSKLIVLNGPLGIGKTTLAKRYASEHIGSVCIDIDELRMQIPNWREDAKTSGAISKARAVQIARTNLLNGYDVIIPQIYRDPKYLTELETLAEDCGAEYFELLLDESKEQAIHRFIERGKREGKPLGFNPEGLIGRQGGIKYLEQMYDEMMQAVKSRPNTIRIISMEGEEDATYHKMLASIK